MVDKQEEEIVNIINNSGNSFQCTVLSYLEDKKWNILVSPYYTDILSNKPREIDIIAEKAIHITTKTGIFLGIVNIQLIIECKYIHLKNVFWFHTKDKEKADALIERKIRIKEAEFQEHHYFKEDQVAKLFADEKSKSIENEIFYKALTQILNATIYYRKKKSITKFQNGSEIIETLKYPVIICNNFERLYRIKMGQYIKPEKINDNFLLEVNYSYLSQDGKEKDEYFLIDIIDFYKIDQFLNMIILEARLTGNSKKKYPPIQI